jgi:iron complex outermembrane recepter protein
MSRTRTSAATPATRAAQVRRILLAATALPALMAAAPTVAHAQAAPAAEAAEEVVIVSARRREEALQDVPVAVSAVSAAQLEAVGAPDITVLQQATPNATVQVARGSNSTLIAFIRGVGQQDPLWGFEPGVGLYVDDVYVARPQGAVLDIFDIQRIEVLRGPQGTLYGRNTIGGAIKYVTRKLGNEPALRARLALGSYGQVDTVVSGSTPLSDTFRVGAAVADYQRDGYGRNVTTGAEHYNKDVFAYRLSAEWEPTDSFFARLAYDRVEDSSNARHGHRGAPGAGLTTGVAILPDVYDTDAGIGSDNWVFNQGLSLTAEWRLSDALTLKSITAAREGESDTLIDFDTNQAVALDVPARYEDSQFSQEFQALFDFGRITGVAGLYYLDAKAAGAFDTILGAAALTIATSGQVKTESLAAYADVSFELSEQLSVSVGGRYTEDTRTGTVYRQNFTGLRSPLFGNTAAIAGLLRSNYTNSRDFSEFSPRVSASWEFNDALTAYAAYSEGFKSGGFDMRGDAVLTPNTVNGYAPEYVKSLEFGLKGSLFDGRANFAAALFRADYEGQQITRQEATVTGSIASFVDNAGSSRIQGFELEGSARFTDNLGMTFGLGYTDAKFEEFRSFTVVSGVLTPVNLAPTSVFQNTPEWNGNVAFNYTRQLGTRGTLDTTLSASYRSEYTMFETVNPLLDQTEPVTLVDLGVSWTSPDEVLRLTLAGRNLTDERYKVGGYFFGGALFGNVVNSFYGPPRTWTFSIAANF